jgi:hypothetical protein
MMAMSKKMLDYELGDIEAMLPWHAAGTLSIRDGRRVDDALARDPDLARLYAVIQQEYSATIAVNESLGVPSPRAMKKLFAAIDAEPTPKPSVLRGIPARIAAFLSDLAPRTLAWSVLLGGLVLVLQAAVITAMLVRPDRGGVDIAGYQPSQAFAARQAEPLTRSLAVQAVPRVLVRFAPEARASDIAAMLDNYRASVVESARGGYYRLQIGDKPVSGQQLADLVVRLQNEQIVSLAIAAQ